MADKAFTVRTRIACIALVLVFVALALMAFMNVLNTEAAGGAGESIARYDFIRGWPSGAGK